MRQPKRHTWRTHTVLTLATGGMWLAWRWATALGRSVTHIG